MLIYDYARAAYPAVAVETVEDDRVLSVVLDELAQLGGKLHDEYQVWRTDATGHIECVSGGKRDTVHKKTSYGDAFSLAAAQPGRVALVVYDWHHLAANPGQYRALKSAAALLKATGSILILVAPSWSLPAELRHDVPVTRLPLPTREQLSEALSRIKEDMNGAAKNVDDARLLDAATGLTAAEAENAFALAASAKGISGELVEAEKIRLIRASGHLEIGRAVPVEQVGGLDELKRYMTEQVIPWRADLDLRARGILMVGVPGVGKSLAAKACASMLKVPVLRLDIGRLMGSLVGQSESGMRAALELAEAVAPCVLWVDEIEKGVGGHASSANTDGGTTLRMVGHFLTWLQEHQADILTVATCNDYSKLPAELTRAGRFSERFFLDVPTAAERRAIAEVHIGRLGLERVYAAAIPDMTADWTGAEIEELIISAARLSGRVLSESALKSAAQDIRPLCKVRGKEIAELREWGTANLRRANSLPPAQATGRKVGVH